MDMWNRQKDTGKSMAELFMVNGVPIVKADNNRVQGWLQVKEFLKPMADGKPQLVVFNTCKQLIDDLMAIQADERNPNDCAKEPHSITHICDALRYYCVSRTSPAVVEEPIYRDELIDEEEEDYEDYMTGGEIMSGYITS